MNSNMYKPARQFAAFLALLAGISSSVAQFNWSPAGPVYTSGRARAMVVDRNNNSVLYVGSASGGIFRSDNAGSNWRALNDKQGNVRNISYLTQAIDGTIYAGTGEGFLRSGQKLRAQAGTGLYKIVDTTLTLVAGSSITGTVINRVACSPVNASHIALATNLGIMVSTDGGSTFNKASHTPSAVPNTFYGMDVKFDSNGLLYCSVGNERGGTAALDAIQGRVFKSDNTLLTMSEITPTTSAFSPTAYGRIELAIAPSNANVIYASCAKKNITTAQVPAPQSPSLTGLFVSTDAGSSWELIMQGAAQLDPLTNGGSIGSGDYAHVLTVNPGDPHMLFMASYGAYVFDASPSSPAVGTWMQIGNRFAVNSPLYLHENIHDIKIVPGNPTKFYFVTDAGIYRSSDLVSTNQQLPPSFQAIYKGFVTGQFNSVSPERFPLTQEPVDAVGEEAKPLYGYIGGTGGNGLVYYSGNGEQVSLERSLIGGEVYNAEYSKLLPDAAIFSTGDEGRMYRTTNVRSAHPSAMNLNVYSGSLSVIAPNPIQFENTPATAPTPFRLWENYGQVVPPPDSVFFYNDTVRESATIAGLSTLISQKSFTLRPARPNRFAQIDSIVIRTGTVVIESTGQQVSTSYTVGNEREIFIDVLTENSVPETTISVPGQTGNQIQKIQVYSGNNLQVQGVMDTAKGPVLTVNNTSLLDEIVVHFQDPPFANKTHTYSTVPDPALFYRVFATIFYRYDPGDTVYVSDDNITTKETQRHAAVTTPLRWTWNSNVDPNVLVNGFIPFSPTNRPIGIPVGNSARLAMIVTNAASANQPAIVVSKSPLNLNDPLDVVRVSQSGCYTDDANGNPTTNLIFYTSRPTVLEWSKSGTEIYFATADNKLFRVSHITRLMDLSSSSYNGKLLTDVFLYKTGINALINNPNTPYRTTQIGAFTRTISSISTNNDGSKILVTFAAGSSTAPAVVMNTTDVRKANHTTQVWVDKTGGSSLLSGNATYCSMMEKDNDARVFIGTDEGIVYTDDIYAANVNWVSANNNQLPKVQVFDIEQQNLTPADAYNSGEIYVATNGRGVWSSKSLFKPYVVNVEEFGPMNVTVENNLTMFPNPTAGKLTVSFGSVAGEHAQAQLMDLSGRLVHSENLGTLNGQDFSHTLDVNHLGSGVYIVNISSDSGVQRVSKLVIAK